MMCLIHLYADVQEYAYYDLDESDKERLLERTEERRELSKEIDDEILTKLVNDMFREIDVKIKRKGGEMI